MSYPQWRSAYEAAAAGDRDRARLWNLEHETRIPQIDAFRAELGRRHLANLADAGATLDNAISELLRPVASRWLGLLPRTGDPPPTPLVTHRPRDAASYYDPGASPDSAAHSPSREKAFPIEPHRRFVWVTHADTAGRQVSRTDPTAVARELGLAHCHEGSFVYRIEMPARVAPVFVPTALDAKLDEAWAPPPDPNSPHGMTRDLVDGSPRWPELVVNTADFEGRWVGVLVSPPDDPQGVGSLAPSYMAGR